MSIDNQPDEELPAELKTIEAALRQLTPQGGQLDRDRLMYLAGRNSISPKMQNGFRLIWPLATAALLLISLGLTGRVLYLSGIEARMAAAGVANSSISLAADSANGRVFVPAHGDYSATRAGQFNLVQLRNGVLSHGVDALGPAAAAGGNTRQQNHGPLWPTLGVDLQGTF